MKTLIKLLLFIAVVISITQTSSIYSQESLYKRLGGYDAIAAVTDQFLAGLITSKDMEKFFKGASDDSKKKIRQHVVDFLCEKTGGPCYYIGRPMKESHHGLGINEHEWNITAGILIETLKKFNVPQKEMDEVIGLVVTLKEDIVEKP